MAGTIRGRFVILGVTAVFTALCILAEAYNRTFLRMPAGDFAVFWRTAQLPLENIYLPVAGRPFVYPPSSLPLMKILGLLPQWPAYFLFVALSVFAFYWAGRRLYSKPAMIMGVASPAMIWAVAEGQIAPLLAAVIFLAAASPSIAKGALIALVISIKPQLVFIAPIVLWDDRKSFWAMVVTGLALLAVHIALWGVESWAQWFNALDRFREITKARNIDAIGVSLVGEAVDYGFPFFPTLTLAFIVSIIIAIKKPIDDLAVLIVGCSVFASPHALPYDLVALAPWAAERLLKDRVNWWLTPIMLLYLRILFPLSWLFTVLRPKGPSIPQLNRA